MKSTRTKQLNYYNDKVAETFDEHRMNSNHLYKIETIESFFENNIIDKSKARILELGGGTGLHAEQFLLKENAFISEFIFSDLSEHMLSVARNRLSKFGNKCTFLKSAAEDFKLDQRVDCIYISGAMHHFEDPVRAISNCYDWLSENGIIIICEPIITNPYAWPRVIFKPEEWGQFNVTPKHIYSWLSENGFDILDKKYLHYRSNNQFFHFWLMLEKIPIMNWSAVMFAIVARKSTRKLC